MKTDRELLDIREKVLIELLRYENDQTQKHGAEYRKFWCRYPTWWFKHRTDLTNKDARKALDRLEREGFVESDKSESNNTKWLLTDAGKVEAGSITRAAAEIGEGL